ncbi:PhoU domain-containing protein [Candidatus Woesearchaeota archaeon]|nr:PhoU domain-containing protein [Candidatus Woesearchaeota archaeon]
MEIRKVQRSGSTFYLYLPAAWCKTNRIGNDTQLVLDMSSEGSLVVSANPQSAADKQLTLSFSESSGKLDRRLINMFIVASYLNPVRSFKIKLNKPISSLDILDQKRMMSSIELVEFGEDHISCESTISVEDPDVILKTMIRKMVNMIRVMQASEAKELVQRYEEEIDRSNTLIQKSAISSLMFKRSSKLRHIELFYIAMISKSLEGLADHLILLTARQSKSLAEPVHAMLLSLLKCLDSLDYRSAASFATEVLGVTDKFDNNDIHAHRIKAILQQLSETLIDWAVTNEVESKK